MISRQKRVLRYVKVYYSMLNLMYTTSKKYFYISFLLLLLKSILPITSLYILKKIIDIVTNASNYDFSVLVYWVLFFCGVLLLQVVSNQLFQYYNSLYQFKITDFLTEKVLKKAIGVNYSYYENPAYNDTLHLSQTQVNFKSGQIITAYFAFFQQLITSLSIIVFLMYYNWWYALLIIMMSIPLYVVSLLFSKKFFGLEKKLSPKEREANYINRILSSLQYAKEVRSYGFGEVYISKYSFLRKFLFDKRKAISNKQNLYVICTGVFEILLTGYVFYALAKNVWQATMTISVFVIYLQGFQKLQATTKATLQSLVSLYGLRLFLEHINYFLGINSKKKTATKSFPKEYKSLTIQGLSFKYPNASEEALSNVSMSFKKGQFTAIVGENGSGKSTLIKILGKLYAYKSGTIKIGSDNFKEVLEDSYRENSTFLFQDTQEYYVSVAENITLGTNNIDAKKLISASEKGGALQFINQLPNKFNTLLGRMFSKGTQLSGGQWQKIAMSRMFYRDSNLILLDEPTSAIDANAEYDLLQNINNIKEEKIVVFVTHRLYNLKIADQIYLLKDGKMVESGTFDDLLAKKGHFYTMYKKQLLE